MAPTSSADQPGRPGPGPDGCPSPPRASHSARVRVASTSSKVSIKAPRCYGSQEWYQGAMEIEVVVEIPKGTRNKYEADHDTGAIWLDRMLFTATRYPEDYGFVPLTLAQDGDPLDAMVVLEEPTFPGCHIRARPIGVFLMSDEAGEDAKVLCVPATDPRRADIKELADIPSYELGRDRPLLRHLQGARAGQGHRRRGLEGPGHRRGGHRAIAGAVPGLAAPPVRGDRAETIGYAAMAAPRRPRSPRRGRLVRRRGAAAVAGRAGAPQAPPGR